MDLKIKDVAELLNVSESTIRRWLVDGKIPAYRLGQQYRFNRAEIEDWVIKHKQGNKSFHDSAEQPQGITGNKQFSLYRALHKGRLIKNMSGDTKQDVIASTVQTIATDLSLDAEVLTELLLDREALQPTALNNGIGIPHTRDFLLSAHHDVVTVVFPENPLQYGAMDGKPVHTLFFLFACDDKRHLHLLAKIAHLTSLPETIEFLKKKPTKDQFLDYIKNWESQATVPK